MASSSFATWLDRRIISSGVKATLLASRVGVHPSTIGRWRAGKTLPSPDHLLRLADLLSEDPALVFRLAGSPAPGEGQSNLSADEAELLLFFRGLGPEARSKLLEIARSRGPGGQVATQ